MKQCYTSYAATGFFFTMMPMAHFMQRREDSDRLLLYDIFLQVIWFICGIINFNYLDEKMNTQTKSEKLKIVRIGLCVLLFCVLIQHSIMYYSVHYMGRSANILTTLRWTSFILNILSIVLVAIIGNQSNCFFHPTDILDFWLLVATFISSLIVFGECYASLVMFVFVYVFVIKALLQVFFDPQGIMDLSWSPRDGYNNPKYSVVFRTWWGAVYRGKPNSFDPLLILDFDNVEKRVGKNDWRRTENGLFLQFNIIWITRVSEKQIELQAV